MLFGALKATQKNPQKMTDHPTTSKRLVYSNFLFKPSNTHRKVEEHEGEGVRVHMNAKGLREM